MAEHFIPDIFLEYPGAEGESKDKSYADAIAVQSYSFEVEALSTLNRSGGQLGGKGTITPISLDLVHDKGFAKLRKMAGKGDITTSPVKISRVADGKLKERIELTKSKVVFASSSHASKAQDSANVVLTFEKAVVTTYMEQNGSTVTADTTTYDLAQGETT